MRLVVETTNCDACLAWKGAEVDEGVEAVPVGPGRTLDLCPTHREGTARVLALIAEFAADGTRKVNGAAARRVAPSSEVPGRSPNRRGGKRARARRNNSGPVVARSVEVVNGDPRSECPLCPHTSPTTAALGLHVRHTHSTTLGDLYGRVCPLCEHEAATTGGLGVHAFRAHELDGGVVGLFMRARAEGDPLGVIAQRAAAVVEAATGTG